MTAQRVGLGRGQPPGLRGTSYQITSAAEDRYNCIAWAAGDDQRWWWPDAASLRYWPANVPREETLGAFQAAFATLRYVDCVDERHEAGYEKVAIYAIDEVPQHAARQLANGRWTSKLGELDDIEHDLHHLEGAEYGTVVAIMKRAVV